MDTVPTLRRQPPATTPTAPARTINCKVLKAEGSGTSASLLAGLNWILAPSDPTKPLSSTNPTNAVKFSIQVVNMSLGAPAISSYQNDPICRAARALVEI